MGFDDLGAAGRAAVLAGEHRIESPPDADGDRWGPSVVLRPDAKTLSRVERWVLEVLPLVGPGHWATGSSKTAHITVRSLGPRRSSDSAGELTERFGRAVAAASEAVGSVQFDMGAVLLSPISVMLALHPVGDSAARLAAALEEALGQEGWFEKGRPRDIWYLNVVHFTGSIADPRGLVQWVETRDGSEGSPVHAESLEAVQWEFERQQMLPLQFAAFPLGGRT